MTFKFKAAAMAAFTAAVLAPVVASAAPSPVLYGGGATLPANAYAGPSWLTGNPPAGGLNPAPAIPLRLSAPADVGSLFGAYSASTASTPIGFPAGTTNRPTVSYCQTGSGTGRNVLTGGAANNIFADGTCPDYSGTPTGFGAPVTEAHFHASDAPLSNSEYNTYLTNKAATRVEPVQMPAIAGAIGVVYNNTATGTTIGAKPINLTESQVCQIFAGTINNWSQLGYPSKPIKIVYRSDGSGTSFGFSNHLSAVCPTAQPISVTGLSTQSTFSLAFVGGTPPPGAISASGNGGVVNAVFANDGAIGYAEISDATYRASVDPAHHQLQYTTISLAPGINPASGKKYAAKSPLKLPKKFKVVGGVLEDTVIGPNDANGRPTLVTISPAPIRPGCVLLADPNGYATSVLKADGDYQYYPIMAVSYLMAHSSGNGDDALNIQALLASVYGPIVAPFGANPGNIAGNTVTIGQTKGFAYLSGFKNPTKTIKNCVLP